MNAFDDQGWCGFKQELNALEITTNDDFVMYHSNKISIGYYLDKYLDSLGL